MTINHSEVRALISKHGGRFHGPHIEHLSMEEEAFWAMMEELFALKPVVHPYSSDGARTMAGEAIARGAMAFREGTKAHPKPELPPVDNLLWEIGFCSAREREELHDAHEAIPETISPRKDTTSGQKTTLAERILLLLTRVEAIHD